MKDDWEWVELPRSDDSWNVSRNTYDPLEDAFYESLLYLSDGSYGLRASIDFGNPYGSPGMFSRTLYGASITTPRQIVNSLNPGYLDFEFNDEGMGVLLRRLHTFKQRLDLRNAYTSIELTSGREKTKLEIRIERILPTNEATLLTLVSLRSAGAKRVVFRPGISYGHSNVDLAGRQRAIRIQHLNLEQVLDHPLGCGVICLNRTDSRRIGAFSKFWTSNNPSFGNPLSLNGGVYVQPISFDLKQDTSMQFIIATSLFEFSKELSIDKCVEEMLAKSSDVDPRNLIRRHIVYWREKWEEAPCIEASEAIEQGSRYGAFQLMQVQNHNVSCFNLPARGLSSEYHSGHFFFNTEFFLVPYYTYIAPGIAKAFIKHRIERLPAAMQFAQSSGFCGARFPEESDDLGQPAAPHRISDIFTRDTVLEWSGIEVVHISADVIYALDRYLRTTSDKEFVRTECVPLIVECATYLASVLQWCPELGAYSALGVMGFDEYHYHVDHHFSTNWLCRWAIQWVLVLIDSDLLVRRGTSNYLMANGKNLEQLIISWQSIVQHTYVPEADQCMVYPIFKGYFSLPDQEIIASSSIVHSNLEQADAYRAERMENFTTRLAKQADVVFLMSLFPKHFTDSIVRANLDYYEPRTTHGSSLSTSAHSSAAIRTGRGKLALELLEASFQYNLAYFPRIGYENGVHIAAYAGAFLVVIENIAGLQVRDANSGDPEVLHFDPKIPNGVRRVMSKIWIFGRLLTFEVRPERITLRLVNSQSEPLRCMIRGQMITLYPGILSSFHLSRNYTG
ncbi:Kojibiose phosphorylase [Pseudomonas fluorescens]|nr:Kojibiose phosphorylase [Pseudomonas fluorescens]